jgi:hypothetical protein
VKVPDKKRQHANRRPQPARREGRVRSGSASYDKHANPRVAWYVGLALMAVFEVVDWPVAIIIAVGHEITHRAHSQALRELADGIEAGG